jgi:hypothetical protein
VASWPASIKYSGQWLRMLSIAFNASHLRGRFAPGFLRSTRFPPVLYAALRIGPALATSRHAIAQRVQASAHLRIVSTCLCCPHSAAQASQISAQTLQSSCANRELDESKLAQTEHTGAHSWHRRIDAAILEGSLRPSSTQAEHQCKHWRHASIARSTEGLGALLAIRSPFFRTSLTTIIEHVADTTVSTMVHGYGKQLQRSLGFPSSAPESCSVQDQIRHAAHVKGTPAGAR